MESDKQPIEGEANDTQTFDAETFDAKSMTEKIVELPKLVEVVDQDLLDSNAVIPVNPKYEEMELFMEIDETYDLGDPDVVLTEKHIDQIDILQEKVSNLEERVVELTGNDLNKALDQYSSYRKWILSIGKQLEKAMNEKTEWREKIAFAKRVAIEMVLAAGKYETGKDSKRKKTGSHFPQR